MITVTLLALTPVSDAPTAGPPSNAEAPPACLQRLGDVPLVRRLVDQLPASATVEVLTLPAWRGAVQDAVPEAAVHVIDRLAEVPRHLAAGSGLTTVLHAHLSADAVAVGHLADGAAGGTAAVLGPVTPSTAAVAAPVRTARGRVIAAGSAQHRLVHTGGWALGALRLGAGDREAMASLLTELADHLDDPPEGWVPVAGADLPGLLLVTLVRGGVAVGAQGLPAGGAWHHPTSTADLEVARDDLDAVDEEQLRLAAAVKSDDGFFTTFLVSPYSRYWARWAARRGFTPNQVTTVSMLVGIAAAAAFATGDQVGLIVGAVLLQLAFTLDCVDGQLARYARRFSTLGAWLDSVFDRAKEYVVLAGLAVGGIRAGEEQLWLLAGAALALQTFRHVLDLGYAEQQTADLARDIVQPLAPVDEAGPTAWEAVPADARPPTTAGTSVGTSAGTPGSTTTSAPTSRTSLPRRGIGLLRGAERVRVLRWAKRIIVLPIGERFALISVVAVVAGPRAVLLALLVWGGLATAYTTGGRVIRSFA